MWLQKVRPLWLREKLFWKFFCTRIERHTELFRDVHPKFVPNVKLSLEPTDIAHKEIAVLGYVDLPLTRALRDLALAGGLLIDVGANYGYFTSIWAASAN